MTDAQGNMPVHLNHWVIITHPHVPTQLLPGHHTKQNKAKTQVDAQTCLHVSSGST